MNLMIASQTRRIVWAFIFAFGLAFHLLLPSRTFFSLFSPHEGRPEIVPLLRSFGALGFSFFVIIHLALFWWYSVDVSTKRFQFSMLHMFIATVCGFAVIGLNFIPDRYPIYYLLNDRTPSKSDPVFYGFPFEILRQYHFYDATSKSPQTVLSFGGLAANAIVLLLFMANILVLTFVKSETASSAPVSAPHNASH